MAILHGYFMQVCFEPLPALQSNSGSSPFSHPIISRIRLIEKGCFGLRYGLNQVAGAALVCLQS
jgi:hypothetical protein